MVDVDVNVDGGWWMVDSERQEREAGMDNPEKSLSTDLGGGGGEQNNGGHTQPPTSAANWFGRAIPIYLPKPLYLSISISIPISIPIPKKKKFNTTIT